jgi:glycosyltransferase involved in cell wall biosynthesis
MHPASTRPAFDLVVPVFNEAESLPIFFSRLQALDLNCQVIFVDNASTDGSLHLLRSYPQAHIVEHKHNQGYGASIIDGIKAGINPDIVIIDADCEYPPECIPQLLLALDKNPVVYTSRFLAATQQKPFNAGYIKKWGNQLLSFLFSCLYAQQVSDLYTGCKALKRSCLDNITLQNTGFEHVLELSVKLAAQKFPIGEIAVEYSPRQVGKSKMNHLAETAKYFYWLMRYTLQYKAGKL